MATTSLWRVKVNLGRVVDYAKNPDKTSNPEYEKKYNELPEQEQWLKDVIDYAVQIRKTGCAYEGTELIKQFVTGINCMPETARDEMMETKAKYGKFDGVIAYHGYLSFAPGEGAPEIAHEIGVKLAQKLWGKRHEVVIATHLDKEDHLHCHFVLNNVSFVDGIKFRRTPKDYYQMRRETDALCREYKLTVIDNPKSGKGKHYAEWQAEKKGEPTYRGMVKADVDDAIRESMTERQFMENLRKKGYQIKCGQDITVRHIGKERGLKLKRNFGEDYSIESIRERMLDQSRPERCIIPGKPPPKKMRLKGNLSKKRMTGLRALYFYYLYRLGVFPRKYKPNPKRVYFLFREDIRHIQNISRETRLLVKHDIETDEQLKLHKNVITNQINMFYEQRKRLRNNLRKIRNNENQETLKSEIAALTEKLKDLRREVRYCESIEKRSVEMRKKLQQERENEKNKEKEMMTSDQFRRCR